MKVKNIVSFVSVTVFILFLVLYISEATGYYEFDNYNKSILTNEAIERFENDIKEGKNLTAGEYLEEEKDYKNLFNKTGVQISNIIEKIFNKTMKKFIREINKVTK